MTKSIERLSGVARIAGQSALLAGVWFAADFAARRLDLPAAVCLRA